MNQQKTRARLKQATVIIVIYSVLWLLFMCGMFNVGGEWWTHILFQVFLALCVAHIANSVAIARLSAALGGNEGMAAITAFLVGPLSIGTFATLRAKANAAVEPE